MDLVERPDSDFERHPWELARADFFIDQLLPIVGAEPHVQVLDAGAGDGWFAHRLAQACAGAHITCYDPNYGLVAPAPVPDEARRVEFTAVRPASSYGVLILLDVLEHIEHDAAELAGLVSNVSAGGRVLISVPAWQRLFSPHDVALQHFRRYSPPRARALISQAGLTIEREGGLFHSLLVARAAQRLIERARTGPVEPPEVEERSLQWRHGPLAGRAVTAALRADAKVAVTASRLGWSIPGLSWWSMCRKP